MSKKHAGVVQKQFTKTVDAFSKFATRDTPEILAERVAIAKPLPHEITLDVACGPGTLVLALAPHVRFARGVDLTHAMLRQAAAFQAERQIANACFDQGESERLPYPDATFDLVTCQFALHHMVRPEATIREMSRVSKAGGRVLIADTVGPESDEKWELHNRVETIRDPSHVASLRLTTYLKIFEEIGLSIGRQNVKPRPRSFHAWMLRAGVEPSNSRYQETLRLIEEAIPGDRAGFAARYDAGELTIVHYEGMFLLGRQ
jgi:ubiquinone/menaquinone biosynthesis C-methylase UbiE